METRREATVTDDLPLEYALTTTAAPVQAEGTVAGHPFYFHARHDAWAFSVSESASLDPADVAAAEAAAGHGWYRSGRVGWPWEFRASYLTAEEAAAIIRSCAAAYVADRAARAT